MVKISKRLEMIADRVPAGSRLADIGSDHALLPVYLAQMGKICFAIAGEVNPGPFQAANMQIKEAGLESTVHVRLGDGLEVIRSGEVDVITIAGMGGNLIMHILSAEFPKLTGVNRLILQPNVGEDQVRRWLYEHDWYLEDETILEEDGRIYEVLTAVKEGNAKERNRRLYGDYVLSCGLSIPIERLLRMGPHLLRKPTEVLYTKWNEEIIKLETIHKQLSGSESGASMSKQVEIGQEIRQIKGVLNCLQKGKP